MFSISAPSPHPVVNVVKLVHEYSGWIFTRFDTPRSFDPGCAFGTDVFNAGIF